MSATKPKLNVRLLRRIQRHIMEEPRRFFMSDFIALGEPGEPFKVGHSDLAKRVPPCGTAACIAGWALLLSKKPVPTSGAHAAREAAEVLGIQHKDVGYAVWGWSCGFRWLMNAGDWPEPFRGRYEKAKTPAARAKVAVARIDHLIKTKGAE